jgi:hypothetical protein
MLTNIGYHHAMCDYHYDCIVIHDVDILPEDDRNLYYHTLLTLSDNKNDFKELCYINITT